MPLTFQGDLNNLTKPYVPSFLVNQIFRTTPTLTGFKNLGLMRLTEGPSWEPLIEIAYEDGEFYDEMDIDSGIATLSDDISTKAHFEPKYYRKAVKISDQQKVLSTRGKVVDLVASKMKNAMEAARTQLGAIMFTGSDAANPAQWNGLERVVSDGNTCGGIDPSDAGVWKSVYVEGTSTFTVPVSPSLAQINEAERAVYDETGENPDVWIVAPRYWTKLLSQVETNDYLMAMNAMRGNNFVKWGFQALFTASGTPIVRDPNCSGAAWGTNSTRAAAAGYQAYGINYSHTKLVVINERFFQWDPEGWRRLLDHESYINKMQAWATIGTDMRKANVRIFNVDITQSETAFALTAPTVPTASAS